MSEYASLGPVSDLKMRIGRPLRLFSRYGLDEVDRFLAEGNKALAGHPHVCIDAVARACVSDRCEFQQRAVALGDEKIVPTTTDEHSGEGHDELDSPFAQDHDGHARSVEVSINTVPRVGIPERTELEPLPTTTCRGGV